MSTTIVIPHRRKDAPVFTSTTARTIAEAVKEARTAGADLRGADLRDAVLSDADLRDADLSGAVLRDADLRDAVLSDADLRGADLSGADLRGADLRDADLRGADLRDAVLSDADLSDADLRGADLSGADLRDAVLRDAVLRDAVGFTAESVTGKYSDIPVITNIHRAVLAAATAEGCRLDMRQWHTCDTTHCRAGWVTHLAGKAGKALEARLGPAAAAMRIYLASDPDYRTDHSVRLPGFYGSNEKAMADMIACAEREAKRETQPVKGATP